MWYADGRGKVRGNSGNDKTREHVSRQFHPLGPLGLPLHAGRDRHNLRFQNPKEAAHSSGKRLIAG